MRKYFHLTHKVSSLKLASILSQIDFLEWMGSLNSSFSDLSKNWI